MNSNILSVSSPKDYYKAFLEKKLRPDRRILNEKRAISSKINVLESEKYSCLSYLGDAGRLLSVLKVSENKEFKLKIVFEEEEMIVFIQNILEYFFY